MLEPAMLLGICCCPSVKGGVRVTMLASAPDVTLGGAADYNKNGNWSQPTLCCSYLADYCDYCNI